MDAWTHQAGFPLVTLRVAGGDEAGDGNSSAPLRLTAEQVQWNRCAAACMPNGAWDMPPCNFSRCTIQTTDIQQASHNDTTPENHTRSC